VRRVFPAYGDPVGRAVFESELAEIGRATTKDEALRRANAFRQRTRERVEALIGAVSGAERLAVEGEAPSRAGGRAPTAAMVSFAKSLAARKGIPLPPEAARDAGACRVFLNTHAGPKMAPSGDGATRPPTPAMLRFAASLAREKRIEALPPEVETDFAACRAFLDAHAGGDGPRSGSKAAPARGGSPGETSAKTPRTRRPRSPASPGRAPRRRRAAEG
jgi:DNA topoisomerase-3